MKLIEHASNIHELQLEGTRAQIAMLSDLHWDNPKCDWKLLKYDLDYCLKESIPIMINGDMFCLMQGRGDNRKNKSDIRPEHNNAMYLDSIVDTAVEFFSPYAHLLTVIGYGNHETAIIKFQETDILARFVQLLNIKCSSNVKVGGYGGWFIINQTLRKHGKSATTSSTKIKYFHGSGGGGVVTKGALNLTRALEMYETQDVFTLGHIHENSCRNDVRDSLEHFASVGYRVKHKHIHSMITGTYKEEYQDGSKGWHIERGAPVKPLGGRILKMKVERIRKDGEDCVNKYVDSQRFL